MFKNDIYIKFCISIINAFNSYAMHRMPAVILLTGDIDVANILLDIEMSMILIIVISPSASSFLD